MLGAAMLGAAQTRQGAALHPPGGSSPRTPDPGFVGLSER
jgi:hypothetical protein